MNVYFAGLNGVRFIAASFVILAHIEGFKRKAELPNLFQNQWLKPFIAEIGHQGVLIFFVLSGFLITYLLLTESKITNTIHIKNFYIRRILRIWPLYYFIVFLGFAVFPFVFSPEYFTTKIHPDFSAKLFLTLFFLPNAVFFVYGHIFSLGVLWSIGAEEQFYLVWPMFIKKMSAKSGDFGPRLTFLGVLLLAILFIKMVLWLVEIMSLNWTNEARIAGLFLPFDSMIIGAVIAVFFFHKKYLQLLYKPQTQILVLAVITINLFYPVDIGPLTNTFYCIFYGIFLLNIATNNDSILKFRQGWIEFLGQVSFGMYMYHSIAIAFSMAMLEKFGSALSFYSYNFLLYLFSFSLTIGVSIASYYFFERKVLKYKTGFMVVNSGKII